MSNRINVLKSLDKLNKGSQSDGSAATKEDLVDKPSKLFVQVYDLDSNRIESIFRELTLLIEKNY